MFKEYINLSQIRCNHDRSVRTFNKSRRFLKNTPPLSITSYTNRTAGGFNACILERSYAYRLGVRYFHNKNAVISKLSEHNIDKFVHPIEDDTDEVRRPSEEFIDSLDAESRGKLKLILLEIDSMNCMGRNTPLNITDEKYTYLLQNCSTSNSRRKELKFWRRNEFKSQNEKLKQAERQRIHQEKIAETQLRISQGIEAPSQLLMRVISSTMNMHYNNNLFHAMHHGLPLVIDMGFYEESQKHGHVSISNLLEQMTMVFGFNKVARDPFYLVLCNTVPSQWGPHHGSFRQYVNRDVVPVTVTEKSYLDLYPKKDLVYLSPDARETLSHFDANKIYILGGIVDKRGEEPLTLAKAKKEGIAAFKLPLDKYTPGGRLGSTALTLDIVLKILLHVKDEPRGWENAIVAHLPKRKTIRGRDERADRIQANRLSWSQSNN